MMTIKLYQIYLNQPDRTARGFESMMA